VRRERRSSTHVPSRPVTVLVTVLVITAALVILAPDQRRNVIIRRRFLVSERGTGPVRVPVILLVIVVLVIVLVIVVPVIAAVLRGAHPDDLGNEALFGVGVLGVVGVVVDVAVGVGAAAVRCADGDAVRVLQVLRDVPACTSTHQQHRCNTAVRIEVSLRWAVVK
jgi:hypothetical protein